MTTECRSLSVIYLKNLICRMAHSDRSMIAVCIVCKAKRVKPPSPHMAIHYYTLLFRLRNCVFLHSSTGVVAQK